MTRSTLSICVTGVLAFVLTACDAEDPTRIAVPSGKARAVTAVANTGDDRAALQSCVDQAATSDKLCQIPAGTWTIAQPVELKSGVTVEGTGGTPTIHYNTTNWPSGVFESRGDSAVTVRNIHFVGPSAARVVDGNKYALPQQFGLLVYSSKDIAFRDNTATNIALIGATLEDKTNRADSLLNRRVTIVGNKGYGPCGRVETGECVSGMGEDHIVTAIWLEYTRGATVESNDVSRYNHGIQWWGGGAATETDVHKAGDMTIRHNRVDRVMAGIWGSLGENIRVEFNTATNCDDICLDDEGGKNNVFYENTAKYAHYVLGSYFSPQNLLFEKNHLYQKGSYYNQNDVHVARGHVFHRLKEHSTRGASVTLRGNDFTWEGSTGFGEVHMMERSQSFRFNGNALQNVTLSFAGPAGDWPNQPYGHGGVEVVGNRLHFTRQLPQGTPAIWIGGNTLSPSADTHEQAPAIYQHYQVHVDQNTISSDYSPQPTPAIRVGQGNYCSCDINTLISRNRVSGFTTDVHVMDLVSRSDWNHMRNRYDIKAQAPADRIVTDAQNAPDFIKFGIQTYTGHYFYALYWGGSSLTAEGTQLHNWETFYIVDLNGGSLQHGDQVYVQTSNPDSAYYMGAEGGGGSTSEVNAIRVWPDPHAVFTLVYVGGTSPINYGSQIAFQTPNGVNYVQAWGGGGAGLSGAGAGVGNWETFALRERVLP